MLPLVLLFQIEKLIAVTLKWVYLEYLFGDKYLGRREKGALLGAFAPNLGQ